MKYLIWGIIGSIGLGACSMLDGDERLKRKAARIHKKVLTIDTHVDTPLRIVHSKRDLGVRSDSRKKGGKLDFIRMEEGGLDVAWFATYVGQGERNAAGNNRANARVMDLINSTFNAVAANQDLAQIGYIADDAERITESGKKAIFLGVENGYAIGNDLSNLDSFYRMGARYMTLCHVKNNDICDSSGDTTEHNGLSDFGREVVKRMNSLGMMIDVSHISDKSYYDVLEVSTAPVIASHSGAREVRKHDRNFDDNMLLALKKNGGVLQLNILSSYVKKLPQHPMREKLRDAWDEKYVDFDKLSKEEQRLADDEYDQIDIDYPKNLATVADAVDHIDHIVKIAGIEHVGIGTDFDGGGALKDCYDVSELGNITLELVRRGYSKNDIEKIWGGNFQRVFRAAEKAATEE